LEIELGGVQRPVAEITGVFIPALYSRTAEVRTNSV